MWLMDKLEKFKIERNLQSRNQVFLFFFFFSGDWEAEGEKKMHSRKFHSRQYLGANEKEHD